MAETDNENSLLVNLTARITSAYVSNNNVAQNELPVLIKGIFGSLTSLDTLLEKAAEPQMPAVTIKKSITDDYLVCLEDGRRLKSLKRHLRTKYDLSPEDYRAKWGLAKTYPTVAPAYATARSNLAKQIGLGRRAAEPKATPARTRVKAARKARPAKA
jgi:predicted transcriptional regulator